MTREYSINQLLRALTVAKAYDQQNILDSGLRRNDTITPEDVIPAKAGIQKKCDLINP